MYTLSKVKNDHHVVFYHAPCGRTMRIANIFNLNRGIKEASIVFIPDEIAVNSIVEIAKLVEVS